MTRRNPTRQLTKATKSARDAEYDYARMRSEYRAHRRLGHTGEISTTEARMRREVKKRRKKAHRRMDAPLIREARMNTDIGKWRKVGRYLWVYSVGGYDILVIRPGGIPQGEPGNSVNWDNPDYYVIFIIDPMVGYPTFDIAQGTPDPLPKWATHGSDRFAGDRIITSTPMYGIGLSIGKVKATAMDFLRWTMSHRTRRIASLMSEEAWYEKNRKSDSANDEKDTKCTHPKGHFVDNQGYCHCCGIPMNESASVKKNPLPAVLIPLVMAMVPIIMKMGQGKVEKYKNATLEGKVKMLRNWSWLAGPPAMGFMGVGPFKRAGGKRVKRMRESLAMAIDDVLKDPQKLEAIQAAGEVGVAGVQAYGASKGKVSPIRKRRRRRIQAKKNREK